MAAGLVKRARARYPAGSMALDKDTLRTLARAQGLDLGEADLDGLLPLVQGTRALIDELATARLDDIEPTALYHVL